MKFRQSLFWDVSPKKISEKKHSRYIIERIMDFGNDKEVRWAWKKYPHNLINEVIKTSRTLHSSTKTLWKLLLKNQ